MLTTANLVIVDNPRAQLALEQMRDRSLPTELFRGYSDEVARCLAERVAADVGEHHGPVVLAPILRAGLALEPAFRDTVPDSAVHHIGVERDEQTFVPKVYYPRRVARPVPPGALTIMLDPMNATAGTAVYGLKALRAAGASRLIFVNVISSQEGVARIHAKFPDVVIYTLAVDPELDSNKYIVPGLGDYGDRYFGT